MTTYVVDEANSSLSINGKSSLHPIHGRLRPGGLRGKIDLAVEGGRLVLDPLPTAELEIVVEQLGFGNAMYDRELPKRLETARYPTARLRLVSLSDAGDGGVRLGLALDAHGRTLTFDEEVELSVHDDGVVSVRGSHRFDVRSLGIEPPRMLGLRVYPDFEVVLSVTLRPEP
jgi:polyisoprenoid-binding protein YceI